MRVTVDPISSTQSGRSAVFGEWEILNLKKSLFAGIFDSPTGPVSASQTPR